MNFHKGGEQVTVPGLGNMHGEARGFKVGDGVGFGGHVIPPQYKVLSKKIYES